MQTRTLGKGGPAVSAVVGQGCMGINLFYQHRVDLNVPNVGAAAIPLTHDDLARNERALQGDRYPAHLQQRVGR